MTSRSRLEEFHRVVVGVLRQDLLSARTNYDFVAKRDTCLFHLSDPRGQVLHLQNEAFPAAGFWAASIWHWPRSRTLRAAQSQCEVALRDDGKSRTLLPIEFEPKILCVESNSPINIADYVSDCKHLVLTSHH
jgi:hypothetical protein